MLRSFLRSLAAGNRLQGPRTSLTFYHSPNSAFSSMLLSRLNGYGGMPCTKNKYDSNGPETKWSSSNTTSYGKQELQVNRLEAPSKFGIELKENKHLSYQDYLFIANKCVNIHPDNKRILQKVLGAQATYHLEPLNQEEYTKLISNKPLAYPLVIDYENHLIANDDKSFDRIMSNYSSSGIQNFGQSRTTIGDKKFKYREIVHPHVADFADLF